MANFALLAIASASLMLANWALQASSSLQSLNNAYVVSSNHKIEAIKTSGEPVKSRKWPLLGSTRTSASSQNKQLPINAHTKRHAPKQQARHPRFDEDYDEHDYNDLATPVLTRTKKDSLVVQNSSMQRQPQLQSQATSWQSPQLMDPSLSQEESALDFFPLGLDGQTFEALLYPSAHHHNMEMHKHHIEHHIEHHNAPKHAKKHDNYMYAESMKKGHLSSGFKLGNKKMRISGKQMQKKSHAKGHFKWKAKKGKGSHYWHFEHSPKHKRKKHY